MRLKQKQVIFTNCVHRLLAYAEENGIEVTLGDAYRDPRSHGEYGQSSPYGNINSLHKLRLAIDLNLHRDGVYINHGYDEYYVKLGEYWKTLNPLCRWGGDFGDPNHFSVTHDNRK